MVFPLFFFTSIFIRKIILAYFEIVVSQLGSETTKVTSQGSFQDAVSYWLAQGYNIVQCKKIDVTVVDVGALKFFYASVPGTRMVCQANSVNNVYYYLQDVVSPSVNPKIIQLND